MKRLALAVILLLAATPRIVQAQRALHWDALDVDAKLDADGVLDVAERHTMVFTGDWNGGERVFNIRPRQTLQLISVERIDPSTGAHPLQSTYATPNNVDEFVLSDGKTLRWRSRLPGDRPFANTRLDYVLRYRLSGILLKDGAQYALDHDFAFPDRVGDITRFSLNLTFAGAWQPLSAVQQRYTAGPLKRGRSFVLTIPLRFAGAGAPAFLDTRRPPEVVQAVSAILGAFVLAVGWLFFREQRLGRFAPVSTAGIDQRWVEQNILMHPAEVVGAAWDGQVSSAEVVALIARMTGEGKLESTATSANTMSLRLLVDRETLQGHERALVDGLFFDGRTETSTAAVRTHYQGKGFNPATTIAPELDRRVKELQPDGPARVWWLPSLALFVAGAALLWSAASRNETTQDETLREAAFVLSFAFLFGGIFLQVPGWLFRSAMNSGRLAAALSLIPALAVSLAAVVFLWWFAGTGRVEIPWTMTFGIAAWAMCLSNMSINGMKSRHKPKTIAFRKRLTAGRRYFEEELAKPNPALRDSWYPWLLAFGLGKDVDDWSTRNPSSTRSSTWNRDTSHSTSSSSSSSSSSDSGWSGGGGRSGGAGASATWAAAAAGMAAGVAAPSSSSSGGGGSSGGGSSGGGGGGGW